MRILIISNYYPPVDLGGWEQLTRDVVDKLIARGHQIRVLTSNYRKETISQIDSKVWRVLHLESKDPYHYHPLTSLLRRRHEEENDNYLKDAITEHNPDIVFINGMWNLPVSIALNAEKLLPKKVIYYMASYWPIELDAHSAYWDSPAEGQINRYLKQTMGNIVKRAFLDDHLRNQLEFNMVLCVSKYVQDIMVQQAGIPRHRTRIVHNGIDLNLYKVKSEHLSSEKIRLLYAGRLAPEKGVHTILESFAILIKKSDLFGCKLSIYGHGSLEYEEQLHEQVSEYQLTNYVDFRGLVPHEAMPDVLAQHDVLIFPSVWAEPLARIVQEAMACGLVVIGTHTGGTSEILVDDENGLVFEAENALMLAERIDQMSCDKALRQKLSAAARLTVQEGFSLENMVDQIESAFSEMLVPSE